MAFANCRFCGTALKAERLVTHEQWLCPKRQQQERIQSLPFFSPGINAGPAPISSLKEGAGRGQAEILSAVIEYFQRSSSSTMGAKESSIGADLFIGGGPTSKVRHAIQNEAILAQIVSHGLLSDYERLTVVELGAGKNNLALFVAETLGRGSDSDLEVITVDRSSTRHSAENRMRELPWVSRVDRFRMDIGDLNLAEVLERRIRDDRAHSILVCGKHVCGSATDRSIRCFQQALQHAESVLALALCCRHRCSWSDFIDREYFLARHLATCSEEFEVITTASAWSLSPGRKGYGEGSEERRDDISYRRLAGTACRWVIDQARMEALVKFGLQVALVPYVHPCVSPENALLLAWTHERQG